MTEEEKKAVEYYSDKEVSFEVDFDTKNLLKALGITEEDSFENHKIRFKTLLNLITKLQKENEHWKNGFERELQDNRKNTCELLKQDLIIREKDKQIDLMAEVMYKSNTAQLLIEYGIENKEQLVKEFEKLAKEKGK